MFSKILVAVDLNQEASWSKALPQAVELAKASGGLLEVMTVVPDYGSAWVEEFFPADFKEKVLRAAKTRLEDLIAKQIPSTVQTKAHLAYGNIHEKVIEVLNEGNHELLVLASHSPDPLRQFLIGSNAERIVRRSPVSVLVVRA